MSSFPQEHIDLTRVPLIYRMTSKLPLAILHAMSSVVWPILFYLVRYRRATVTRNLEQAFPDMTPAERHDINKAFYRGFVDTAFETVKALDMPAREFKERVTIVNRELLDQSTQDRSQSVIITTLHMGNWEWMLHGVALHFNTIIDPFTSLSTAKRASVLYKPSAIGSVAALLKCPTQRATSCAIANSTGSFLWSLIRHPADQKELFGCRF